MILDINQIVTQLGKEKGIDRKIIIDVISEALVDAAKKKYGLSKDFEAPYDEATYKFSVNEYRTVVEVVQNPDTEIALADALLDDPEAQPGDSIGFARATEDLGRIAAQNARQKIMQRIKDAEREVIFGEFLPRRGEIINGIAQRYERDTLIVDLGKTEAVMPTNEQIPRERFRQGDRIRAYLKDVTRNTRGPEIILSRSDPRMVIELFKQEVPEVYEGVVTIASIAREPGFRTKIAVKSKDRDVDPVGACVGMKGSRVQAVVQELRGERIDIIAWDEDPAKFVCNALQPAEIIRVLVNEAGKNMEVIVAEDQQLLAIGKRGQNVKLASRLVGWSIDVRPEGQIEDARKSLDDLFAKPAEASTDPAVETAPPEADAVASEVVSEAPVTGNVDGGTGDGNNG